MFTHPGCIFLLLTVLLINQPAQGKEEPPAPLGKVIVFLDPGCPIARFHTATLRDCHQKFANLGFQFEAYVPTATATPDSVAAYAEKFALPFPVHADPLQRKARQLDAQSVPEVFVFDAKDRLVYRGRIDDIYTAIGKKRSRAHVHDLKRTLKAVHEGTRPPVARTPVVGCKITFQSIDTVAP